MSSQADYICKECGSADIIAEIEQRRHEAGGRIRERNGKPHFDVDDFDWGYHDYDVVGYLCVCGAHAHSIDRLVIKRRVFDEMRLPCGRCDHDAREHHQQRGLSAEESKRGFVRPLMPCAVCDCHDYYDQALGREVGWDQPGQQTLAA